MTGPPNDHLDEARQHAGLTLSELWVRYFAAGGDHGAIELDAVVNGALAATRDEHDLIAQVLNERFTQLGAGTPVAYSDGTANGIASADQWPAATETVPALRPAPLAQNTGVGSTDEWIVASIHLDPDDIAPRRARRWAGEMLHHHGRPELSDVTATGLTEVVTNVCLHACTPMTVTMSVRAPATIRFGVRDYSADPPVHRDADDDATTGRGLALLAACGPWGVQEHADGKTVWFEPHTRPEGQSDDRIAPGVAT